MGIEPGARPKKNNDIRLAIDMRQANKAVLRERFPMPNIDETLEQMNGSTVFTRLDMNQAFHQIELEESSRYITTFVCDTGLYRYKRLIYGISSAPEIFQRIMQQMLQDIPGCKSIADDIIIYADSVENHDKILTLVLTRLREANLTLNKDKCDFHKTELKFMGHTLSKQGIKIDDSKVKAVRDAEPPQNASEVKSFLGLVTFCSKFVPNYATIAEPLRKLTRKDVTWEWGTEQQNAFMKLKQCLTSADVIAYYDPNAETTLIVDGSPVGLGAILNQRQSNGDMRPVAYASRTLTPVERRYSQTEREALAVLFGVQRFHLYLYGMKFQVLSDHKALEKIFTSAHNAPARIQNWVLKLQPYTFTVKYLPGPENVADILSRTPLNDTDNAVCEMTEKYVNYITTCSLPVALTLDEVKQASETDQTLTKVRQCIQTDRWEKSDTMRPYYQVRCDLTVKDSLIMKGNKLVIPSSLQKQVMGLAHESHMGMLKTKRLLREKVWFPNIDKQVEDMIKSCHACQMASTPPREPPVSMTDLPTGPWRELGMDITGPFGNEYILVIIDYYTRFPLVAVLRSITSKSIISQLNKWFSVFGYPSSIRTDNAQNFVSQEFEIYLKQHGIKHARATPYFPRSNGLVENFNKSIKKCVQTATAENKNWRNELETFLLHFRATDHCTTGVSPAKLMFNRELKTKLPQIEMPVHTTKLREHDRNQKQKMKMYADKTKSPSYGKFSVGQSVLIRKYNKHKMSQNWEDSVFKVLRQTGTSLKLQSEHGGNILFRNVSHVRPYYN